MSYKTNTFSIDAVVNSKVGVSIQGHSDNLDELSTLNISTEAGKAVVVNSTSNGFETVDLPETIVGKDIAFPLSFSATGGWDADEILLTFVVTEPCSFPSGIGSHGYISDSNYTSSLIVSKNGTEVGTIDIDSTGFSFNFANDVSFIEGDYLQVTSTDLSEVAVFSLSLTFIKIANFIP